MKYLTKCKLSYPYYICTHPVNSYGHRVTTNSILFWYGLDEKSFGYRYILSHRWLVGYKEDPNFKELFEKLCQR
jgi:hypothetical protein